MWRVRSSFVEISIFDTAFYLLSFHSTISYVNCTHTHATPSSSTHHPNCQQTQQPQIRDPNSDQGWATPNQSKSFRILQKITDTIDMLDKDNADLYNNSHNNNHNSGETQPPQFARQMDFNEQQLRRMQLNNDNKDMAYTNGQEGKYACSWYNDLGAQHKSLDKITTKKAALTLLASLLLLLMCLLFKFIIKIQFIDQIIIKYLQRIGGLR